MTQNQPPGCGTDIGAHQLLPARRDKTRPTPRKQGHYPGITIPDDTLPGLSSIGFWDCAVPQDWGVDTHRNEGVEIHFVETGSMVFRADERRFNLGPGDFTITRPGQLHKLGDPHIRAGRVHWLIIDVGVRKSNDPWRWPGWVTLTPRDLAELTHKCRHNEVPVYKSTPEIARIFHQIAMCVARWKTPHTVSRMVANLNQLFVSFLDMPVTKNLIQSSDRDPRRRAVELFLKSLEENPANCEEFSTLEQMAKHCGMGITSFAKHTRECVNVGAMEFLKQCRLTHAAQQLREEPGASITNICFSNGFNSSQYFATCFRKRFNMSPREYVSK